MFCCSESHFLHPPRTRQCTALLLRTYRTSWSQHMLAECPMSMDSNRHSISLGSQIISLTLEVTQKKWSSTPSMPPQRPRTPRPTFSITQPSKPSSHVIPSSGPPQAEHPVRQTCLLIRCAAGGASKPFARISRFRRMLQMAPVAEWLLPIPWGGVSLLISIHFILFVLLFLRSHHCVDITLRC